MAANMPVEMAPLAIADPSKANHLSFAWDKLTYTVGDREILKGLTGKALPGRALAVMGSSGAGKTTFLNAICDRVRIDRECKLTGSRRLNEVEYEGRYRKLIAFVTQEDVLLDTSTPHDAMRFSLRIRRGTSSEESDRIVAELLEELGLTAAKDTMVGIPGLVVGLSGGERKRCNIGVELVSDPKILLLDEPTSGLDAVTSTKIVSLCRDLARKNRTVIYSIHQPTSASVGLFDDLLLLCAGKTVYHGAAADAVAYFAAHGFDCPVFSTPTDYFMTLMQDTRTQPALIDNWAKHAAAHPSQYTTSDVAVAPADGGKTKTFMEHYCANKGAGIGIQMTELVARAFVSVMRNKMYLFMSVAQGIFFGLIAGIIFVKLGDDVQGMQDRAGLLFMVAANKGFGPAMMAINTFPREKAVFIRDQQSGSYSIAIYFLAKIFSELPVQAFSALVEAVIVYFMTGLATNAGSFFHFFAIFFAVGQAAFGIGLLVSIAIDSHQVAAGTVPLIMVPFTMAGGLLASTDRLRPYWIWLEKLSVVRYAFVLGMKNEMGNIHKITCNPRDFPGVDGVALCKRQAKVGDDVIRQFGFVDTDHEYWVMWLSIGLWIVVLRIVCILALGRAAKQRA